MIRTPFTWLRAYVSYALNLPSCGAGCRHVERLAARLRDGIMSQLEGVVVNGDEEQRYAGNMNLSFAYVEGESLIMGLKVRRPVARMT